jgi:hypothetical protein
VLGLISSMLSFVMSSKRERRGVESFVFKKIRRDAFPDAAPCNPGRTYRLRKNIRGVKIRGNSESPCFSWKIGVLSASREFPRRFQA